MEPQNRHHSPGEKRHGRFIRFFQGYLMVAGALATLYIVGRLIIRLFVEIGNWL